MSMILGEVHLDTIIPMGLFTIIKNQIVGVNIAEYNSSYHVISTNKLYCNHH